MDEKQVTPDGKVIDKTLPVSGIRKIVARNMEESLRRSPQVTGTVKVDVSKVVALRNRLKAEGLSYTYTELFAKLVAEAVAQEPVMNSSREENKIYVYSSINMGIAVTNAKDFVLVPVIMNIQDKSLPEISKEVKSLAEKVRDNKITPEEMAGGTITISSMGMFDVDTFTPILNIPQGAIIGLGKIRKEPAVDENGNVVVRDMMNISVTVDHAIIDGVPHARFLTKLAACIKDPETYLGQLR
jgi:pyruvate dehydrogenase E2 component (dihydrolipoamide acetyltransferase)